MQSSLLSLATTRTQAAVNSLARRSFAAAATATAAKPAANKPFRLRPQQLIPLTNFTLPNVPKVTIVRQQRPYPLQDDMKTTTGTKPEFVTLNATLRHRYGRSATAVARQQGLLPLTIGGGVPGRKGQLYVEVLVDAKDIARLLKENGLYCRMIKFNLTTSPDATPEIKAEQEKIIEQEKGTVALIRDVSMNTLDHSCLSIVCSRFVPGRPTKIKVPIRFVNADACVGVKRGGVLLYNRHHLNCVFVGDALPAYKDVAITVDCGPVEISSRVRLNDVKLAPGLTSADQNSNFILLTCKKVTSELGAAATEDE